MRQIDNLSDDANQKVQVVIDDGSIVEVTLRYMPSGQRWFFSVSRASFAPGLIGVCVHPNLLRTWRNVIPFGLMCSSIDGVDPAYVQDWVNGRCSLFVLSAAEVAAVEASVVGIPS